MGSQAGRAGTWEISAPVFVLFLVFKEPRTGTIVTGSPFRRAPSAMPETLAATLNPAGNSLRQPPDRVVHGRGVSPNTRLLVPAGGRVSTVHTILSWVILQEPQLCVPLLDVTVPSELLQHLPTQVPRTVQFHFR